MKGSKNLKLRSILIATAFLTILCVAIGAHSANLAAARSTIIAQHTALFAPAHETETEHPEATETEHPEATETEHPEATETEQPHATRTEHPEATETEHPEGTETERPEATETEHPEATETEHPEATETEHPEAMETEMPQAAPVAPGSGSRTFPETGKTVSGLFLQHWDSNGGLAQQGYPISGVMQEVSPLNGKSYAVQYFERAIFEYHPENQAPYNILLSQLGVFQYKQKYPAGAPNQQANQVNARYFPETRHWVDGAFWAYWQQHGGLAQQGYPISDQFTEVSKLNGKPYTVQYFERAIFELHPENQPPYNVLLSQLGTFRYKQINGR